MSKNDIYRRLAERLSDEQKERVNKFLSECEPSGTYEEIQLKLKSLFTDKNDTTTIKGWLCRDEDGYLAILYDEKPERYFPKSIDGFPKMSGIWTNFNGSSDVLSDNFAPCEITWDSDPVEVEIKIKKIEE